MNRRNMLMLVGGGAVLAATGAIGAVASRTPKDALAPWANAGGGQYTDPRMRALSYAILAPNPHNRQPWTVELIGEKRIKIGIDDDPLLPHTDPFSRQIAIGLGCFLELMRMAAAEEGLRVDLDLFPDGASADTLDPNAPIAIATLTRDASTPKDPLFAHVFARRSTKEPYDLNQAVTPDALNGLIEAAREGFAVGGSVDPDDIAKMRALTSEALMIELETKRTYKESVDLFRIGAREINANPDGIDFSGPMFELMGATGLFSRKAALDRSSMAYSGGIDAVLQNTQTAMGHLWLVTPDNDRATQISTGADWLRINLACARDAIAMQPLSQALQEYPEMAGHYDDIHQMLAPDGGTVQMLVRIGYAEPVPASPRWPIEAKRLE